MIWWTALALGGIAFGSTSDWRTEAELREREQGLEAALAYVERHLASATDDVEAWRWTACTFERLGRENGGHPLFFADAAAAWDRVARLADEEGARVAAVRARLWSGELETALAGAHGIVERELATNGRVSDDAAALLLQARTTAFAGAEHEDRAAYATDLLDVLALIERTRALAPDGIARDRAEAEWLAGMNLVDLALTRLGAAIEAQPNAIDVHRAFVDLYVRYGMEERLPALYETLLTAHPEAAVVRWYAGYAARLAGDLAARERRNETARTLYARCVERMREAADLDAAFAESALWVEMQARCANAWSALDADDTARADAEWLAIVEEGPEFAVRADGLGRTPSQGMGRLGHRFLLRDDLVSAERVSRKVAEVGQQAWSWNNVAYLLRELASDTERSGDVAMFDVARSTFVESWQTYQRAAALAPHEPRIINDTALIQIYHLQDDLDGAEQMLLRAIDVGEQQLEEMGPYAEETERFPVAQAVGDAYQNLGYLYYRLRSEPVKARAYFIKSVDTDSGARRGVVASIRAIDSGRALEEPPPGTPPVPTAKAAEEMLKDQEDPNAPAPEEPAPGGGGIDPVVVTTTEIPEPDPELPPDIDWEGSIDVALEEGARHGRRVLVYHRVGGGIGPAVEFLQRLLHSDGFEQATQGSITVLADTLRHTFTDRRRDGRLVFCPRAPGLTCAEHIACGEEFRARWDAQEAARVGLDANGLFHVTEEGFTRVGQSNDTFERLPRSWGRRPGSPAGFEGEGGDDLAATTSEDAAALATSRSLPARRALEEMVFDSDSPDARRRAVVALAAHPSYENDELLRILARQRADDQLAILALRHWRGELGAFDPLYVLNTSSTAAVRRSAALALARVGDPRAERALTTRWLVTHPDALERLSSLDLPTLAREID